MFYKYLKFSALISMCLITFSLQAQQAVTVAGGELSGSGGVASYSVGQILYNTVNGSNGSVSEGVQQPFEISVVVETDEGKNVYLKCSAYPNPTTDILFLQIENIENRKLSYLLFDTNGKLIEQQNISLNETRIQMNKYQRGAYFLKVLQGKQEIKTFKIIKK